MSKLLFGCNYGATTQTVKFSAVSLMGHKGKREKYSAFFVRYRVNSCVVLFLNLEYITWSSHDKSGRGLTFTETVVVVRLPQI